MDALHKRFGGERRAVTAGSGPEARRDQAVCNPTAVAALVTTAPLLTVVIPTFNERETLERLYPRLSAALAGHPAELVVVDDGSPDGTAAFARTLSAPLPTHVLERPAKLGLASAVQAGFDEAQGDVIVVMDADGSHPPEAVLRLEAAIRDGGAEFALGSRWVAGGSAPGLTRARRILSGGAGLLARPLVSVRDPMSGFFAVRRDVLARAPLHPIGYKIALEVLVRCRPRTIAELPIVFRERSAGESKLGRGEIGLYLRHLGRLYSWRLGRAFRASRTR
jgi:dolichol-phosphate mannosyltransferase